MLGFFTDNHVFVFKLNFYWCVITSVILTLSSMSTKESLATVIGSVSGDLRTSLK